MDWVCDHDYHDTEDEHMEREQRASLLSMAKTRDLHLRVKQQRRRALFIDEGQDDGIGSECWSRFKNESERNNEFRNDVGCSF
jgi:hypothetical protein